MNKSALNKSQQMIQSVMMMDKHLFNSIPINPLITHLEIIISEMFNKQVLTKMILKPNGQLIVS
jgi:hypothetical protein